MNWPAQSLDLNPIEHLWTDLKKRLRYLPQNRNIGKLCTQVEGEWDKTTKDTCVGLVESMPRRMGAVIAAKGGYTKYKGIWA